ncbi:multiubiquitin domain-containing protein, partial [Bradyrhizobium campsiandrae]|uniref:multiubiquitin domain-containing protein n=1 Tax=Bradyrhizobium campsiandrae TaxID=1729892 RepID=UPI001FCE919A
PRDGYSLIAILPSGDFEDVRLNEPFDLRERGAERFIAFQTDRGFQQLAAERHGIAHHTGLEVEIALREEKAIPPRRTQRPAFA